MKITFLCAYASDEVINTGYPVLKSLTIVDSDSVYWLTL